MKTTHTLLMTAVAIGLFAAGQATAAPISKAKADKIIAAVKAGEAQWNADAKSRDAARFASHYADDATVMDPFEAPIHGRAAVEAGMKQTFADPNFTLTFAADSVGVSPDGTWAYTQGHCTETETDAASHAKVTNACSYLTLYRKEADGSWKAVEDIASPAAPPKS